MKISIKKLQKIIKEEIESVLKEASGPDKAESLDYSEAESGMHADKDFLKGQLERKLGLSFEKIKNDKDVLFPEPVGGSEEDPVYDLGHINLWLKSKIQKQKEILTIAIKSGALGKFVAKVWSREPTEKNPKVTPSEVVSSKIKNNLQGSVLPYIDVTVKAEIEDEETGKLYFQNFDGFVWLVPPEQYSDESTVEIEGQEKYKLYGEW